MRKTKKLFDGIESLLEREKKALIIFPVIVLLVGSITHELFHILVLKIYNCPFSTNFQIIGWDFQFVIQPLCELDKVQAINVLSAGIVGNIFLGLIAFFISSVYRIKENFLTSFYFDTIALGFVFTSGFYFFRETGDIMAILQILEIEISRVWIIAVGLIIMIFSTIQFWIEFRSIEEDYNLLHFLKEYKKQLTCSIRRNQNKGTKPRYQRKR